MAKRHHKNQYIKLHPTAYLGLVIVAILILVLLTMLAVQRGPSFSDASILCTLPATLDAKAEVGQPFVQSLSINPPGVYNYAITNPVSGLPPGVTLYSYIGLLYGYPTQAGTYQFTVNGSTTIKGQCNAIQTYTITVAPPRR